MNEYISNELHTKLVIDDIMRDDFTRMDSLDVVKNVWKVLIEFS